jgi:twinkle protein
MAKKLYISFKDCRGKIEALYRNGLTKGIYCGFNSLFEHYSPKMGTTTYIFGSPTGGKSEFAFELLITMSELYGFKHAIYSPETGSPEEIAAELISKVARKPFYNGYFPQMSETEYYRHLDWVTEHFFIIDPIETDITPEEFYNQVDLIESDLGIKIHTTVCDPFNELRHAFEDERQDLYIENKLGMIRRNAKAKNRHHFIITHTTKQEARIVGSKKYYDPPTAHQISGGQAWYRKAMNLIAVWRPPQGMTDEDNVPYQDNEVHIIIQKYKPKGSGKKGTVKLYLDTLANRYYELENGNKRYAGKQPEKPTYAHSGSSDVNF